MTSIGKESFLFFEDGCSAITKSTKVPRNGTKDQNIHPVDLPVSLIRLIRHVTRGINPPSK